jgi:multidrug efflux pump subunit AcrB/ABC-type multidrug transport system ATPase subunit
MTAFFIRRPVLVCMLLTGGCLLGTVSYSRLAVELIPFAELPMLIVSVQSARAEDPHRVEQLAVIPLESAIAGLADIERIESYIEPRRAVLYVYYTLDSDQRFAFLRLQERVAATRARIGDDFIAVVMKLDTEQLSNQFMSLQARGVGSLGQIRHVVDQKVVRELETVDGIANVAVYGGRQHSVEVLLDEDALRSHGLTVSQVATRISQSSRPRRYLGQAVDGGAEHFVNLVSDYTSRVSLEETVIQTKGPLLLGEIATIVDGGAERETIARIDGREAVAVTLLRDRQANLLELSRATRRSIDRLNRELAVDGVELVVQSDAAEVIEENIGDIRSLALLGGLLAIAVLWIFLRNLRLVAIVAAAIPISVLISLNLFYALDITINTLSLVGIAIAIGMLVDNSIVVLENIYRQLSRRGDAHTAVVAGVSEVWRAVAASTLTTICVFLPFAFSGNTLVRVLGRHVGVSIISTLLVSLAVAFLLIPVFTYRLFAAGGAADQTSSFQAVSQRHRLVQIYTLLLNSCLRFPARTVIIAVVALFVSVLLCLAVSISAPREAELDRFDLYATMPGGTTLDLADQQALEMDARLADIAEVAERRIDIKAEVLHLSFELEEGYREIAGRDIGGVKKDARERLEKGFPRLQFGYQQPRSQTRSGGGGGGGNMGGERAFQRLLGIGQSQERIAIRGSDLPLLKTIADDIRYNLDRMPGNERSYLGIAAREPEIDLLLDRAAVAHFGVPPAAIADELSSFQSQVRAGVRLKRGSEEIDIILRSSGQRRVDDLRQLRVATTAGGAVPLLQLAELVYAHGYGDITRVNQEKEIELIYNFEEDISDSKELLAEARAAVDRLVADVALPPGVAVEVIHDETDFSDFYFLIGASVVLIFMILTSVFESFIASVAMMITLPLATIGALWGLILTGNSILNANALVGFMILLGVVVNNGIMLIDFARLLQRRGYRLGRALVTAGQVRVRPILITAISTVLAMLPLAMGKAEYVVVIGVPFATAVIGGLAAGTLFTLVLVPTVYFGMERTQAWIRQLGWKTRTVQLAALTAGAWLIHESVDSTFWQFADGTVLLGLVPALTYFVQNSLRHTRGTIVPADLPLRISIRNVVKTYDEDSRFVRQWGRGERQRARLGPGRERGAADRLASLPWQLPLLAFHFYFAYLYLESEAWALIFSVGFYLFSLRLMRSFLPPVGTSGIRRRLVRTAYQLAIWLAPLGHLFWYQSRWDSWAPVIIVAAIWYLAALIHRGSQRLYRGEVNADRIVGRFRRSRSAFYRLVRAIPFVGRRKRPFTALNQVSLEIESGMFGLIGPNGAGKTTLMRIICGILQQSRGTVRINDIDLSAHREEMQSLIGYLPQEFGTYENMTAYQFLDYQAMLKGQWSFRERRRVVDNAIGAVHLEDSRDLKIKGFSGGMKQRVGIAQTLLHLPRILVVDEPTAGLDPRERIRFRNLLAELARDRVVIFSTHIIEDISSSCNRLAVLGDGVVRFDGSPREMVDLARGAVWQAQIPEARFEEIRPDMWIVHHMRDGDLIRVRILSAVRPLPDAIEVTATLEDSYLWLLEQRA